MIYAEFSNRDFTRSQEKATFLGISNNRLFNTCGCGTCSYCILKERN